MNRRSTFFDIVRMAAGGAALFNLMIAALCCLPATGSGYIVICSAAGETVIADSSGDYGTPARAHNDNDCAAVCAGALLAAAIILALSFRPSAPQIPARLRAIVAKAAGPPYLGRAPPSFG